MNALIYSLIICLIAAALSLLSSQRKEKIGWPITITVLTISILLYFFEYHIDGIVLAASAWFIWNISDWIKAINDSYSGYKKYIFNFLIFIGVFTFVFLFTAPRAEKRNYRGYRCTDDCSGHEAGYQWADNGNAESSDDCSGNSNSFIEGCISYFEDSY